MPTFAASRPIVLYVSEIAPVDTQASSVLVYRHLRALQAIGYEIWAVLPAQTTVKAGWPSDWRLLTLPARRRFYPPFRPSPFWRMIRWWLLDRELAPALEGARIHCVISILQGEYLAGYAGWLSRRLRRPLFYFYHDRGEFLHHASNPRAADRMRRQNLDLLASREVRRIWSVCPELTYADQACSSKFLTVYPLPARLPGASVRWRAEFGQRPMLVYAGSIYEQVVPLLEMVAEVLREFGGTLRLYSHLHDSAARLRDRFPDVVENAGFVPTTELGAQLRSTASAFVIAYPEDVSTMPWCVDCFPSKLTQLVQTGLPGIILAPSVTALGRWCERERWTLYRSTVTPESTRALLIALITEDGWNRAAAESRRAAAGDFSPDHIERQVNEDVRSCDSSAA